MSIKSYDFFKDFYARIKQEGINYDTSYEEWTQDFTSKYSDINNAVSENSLIPAITHMIYLFNKGSKISGPLEARIFRSPERLNEANENWKHNFWTNDPKSIPKSIKNIKNLEIKNINELKEHSLYSDFLAIFQSAPSSKYYKATLTQASDILRLMILDEQGGVYHDCDYEIYRAEDLYKLTTNFDLILGQENDRKETDLGNAFIAAKPQHKMIQSAIKLVERNLHQNELPIPDYCKYPFNLFSKVIFETGPAVITAAYYQYKQEVGADKSIVFPRVGLYNSYYAQQQEPMHPSCSHYGKEKNYGYFGNIKIDTIGADLFCGSWTQDQGFLDEIQYTNNIPNISEKTNTLETNNDEKLGCMINHTEGPKPKTTAVKPSIVEPFQEVVEPFQEVVEPELESLSTETEEPLIELLKHTESEQSSRQDFMNQNTGAKQLNIQDFMNQNTELAAQQASMNQLLQSISKIETEVQNSICADIEQKNLISGLKGYYNIENNNMYNLIHTICEKHTLDLLRNTISDIKITARDETAVNVIKDVLLHSHDREILIAKLSSYYPNTHSEHGVFSYFSQLVNKTCHEESLNTLRHAIDNMTKRPDTKMACEIIKDVVCTATDRESLMSDLKTYYSNLDNNNVHDYFVSLVGDVCDQHHIQPN